MSKLGLRNKLIISIAILIVFISVFQLTIFRGILLSGFVNIEKQDANKDAQRAQDILNQQVTYYSNKISDWAIWDDAYKFVQDKNQAFIDSNLVGDTFKSLDINYMIFIASPGAIFYSQGVDLKTGNPIQLPKDLEEYLLQSNTVTVQASIDSESHGIIRLAEGPLMFAAKPIVKSDNTGPIKGTLIFGRILDKNYISYLADINHSKINIQDYNSNNLEADFVSAKKVLSFQNKFFVNTPSSNQIDSFSIIYDIDNKPAYLLEDELPRPIYNQGATAVNIALGLFTLVSLLSIVFSLIALNKFIISKISRLSKNIDKVKDPTNPNQRLDAQGNDEFAMLAKKFNELLDDSEKFELAINNSSDHIVITDPNLKIIYANKGAEMMTGYTIGEMIGNTPRLWQQESNLNKIIETAIKQKMPFEGEIENKNKSGELYPVEAKIFPILDKSGQIKLLVSVQRDVSSNRRLKEALMMENQQISQKIEQQTAVIQEKEAQLTGLVDSISLGFIMFDMKGKVLFTNPAIERITGIRISDGNVDSVEQALGKVFEIKEKFQKCLIERKAIDTTEIVFNNRTLHVSINPIFSSKELMTLIGAAVLLEDRTQAKDAQRSRDEFFSIASHELRTPLTAIRGNTALLKAYREKLEPKEVEAMINDIGDASIRLIGIVNDFLDTSSLETGKMIYKKESLNLVDLAQETIREYQTTGSLKMLYLTFVPPVNTMENVIGDKDRVKQILVNLVGNAVKYTDKGGVIVSIERDNGFIKALITDTGKGIPQEIQPGLFNKFHQGPKGEIYTRDVIHGSGLGLYISKMLVEGMGGKIALEKSASGIGSTFSFELPMDKGIK